MRFFAKKFQIVFYVEKNPAWIFKIMIYKKKSKSLQVAGTFFETSSEANCPRLVLHVLSWSRVHLSRVT